MAPGLGAVIRGLLFALRLFLIASAPMIGGIAFLWADKAISSARRRAACLRHARAALGLRRNRLCERVAVVELAPLVLSVTRTGLPSNTSSAALYCQFCGETVGKVPDAFAAKVPCCVLCGLVQNLGRPRVDEEAQLIWLPELSQPALNALTRRVHINLRHHGESLETGGAAEHRRPAIFQRCIRPARPCWRAAARRRRGSAHPIQVTSPTRCCACPRPGSSAGTCCWAEVCGCCPWASCSRQRAMSIRRS